MPKPKQALKSYALRLPQDLYAAIEHIAAQEIRPVNSQMLVFLRLGVERWLAEHSESPMPPLPEKESP
jgi:hypothetical protein